MSASELSEVENAFYATSPDEVTREQVLELMNYWRSQDLKVGFTSGAFDILHAGHLSYLQAAREVCDRLVVAVNTDSSIKIYKSELRPIVPQRERVKLVAGLKPVDCAFLFAEKNNNVNIQELKPDYYIKASDYTHAKLSSAPIIEAYGGQVKLLPLVPGLSTSNVIEKVQALDKIASPTESEVEVKPAAFLDRDGTLIKLVDYLDDPERVEVLDGVVEGMLKLQEHGYRIIITTNQPGIGMGYYSKDQFYKVTLKMLKLLSAHGVLIDKIYFSPHTKAEKSRERKPEPGMIERAVTELKVDLSKSLVIGDSTADIEFARRGGCELAGLVRTGKGGEDGLYEVSPDVIENRFNEVVDALLAKAA